MKNVFLVINKEKVYAYAVSILTIITLFFMSSILSSNELLDTTETAINITENVQNVNELLTNITSENNIIK